MSQENVEVVRRWWAGFNDNGLPPFDLCDDQIEIRNPDEFPNTGPYHGHEGVRQWASEAWEIVDEARTEPEEILEVGDRTTLVVVLRTTGHMPHTGIPANVQWAAVFTMRDGKLAHAQGYLSKAEALEAVGLSE
jgi:ketosteroid isomerase-like protein